MRPREAIAALCAASLIVGACGWDPSRPFDRQSPSVNEAIGALDAGDASAATTTLEDYLLTGRCKEGSIGTPPMLRQKSNGAFDLGLSLFAVGEAFGGRFGDEERDAGADDDSRQQRGAQIACALAIVQAIAGDESQPIELRARARYLEGNLHFLGTDYEEAVHAYDAALQLVPGQVDGGDPVGRDAAWNRAVALRRIEDKKDAGNDASPPNDGAPPDAKQPDAASEDAGKDGASGDSGSRDAAGDGGGEGDGGGDGGGRDAASPPPPQPPDAGPNEKDAAPPQTKQSQDERILDQLENAPTVQQEDAKKRAGKHRVRGMVDK